jgi:hypothetical protein
MRVVQRASAFEPSSGTRWRSLAQHPSLAAATARVALVALLVALLYLPRAHSIDAAAGTGDGGAHDCPQHQRGGSILDLPDTADCRRLLRLLLPPLRRRAVVAAAAAARAATQPGVCTCVK